jgi:long-chain acyl-CoA synthetase
MRSSPAPSPVAATLPELMAFAAQRYGQAPFVLRHSSAGWQGFTFDAAARAVWAFAALLEREGVRPRQRVGLQGENRPEWGLAYLATLAAGAVAVPLDAQLGPDEVGEILAAAGATHLVTTERLRAVGERVRGARLPGLRMLSLDRSPGPGPLPAWDDAQRAFADAGPPAPRARPEDLAALIFTSGTTGLPKGVMLSHANLVSNVEAAVGTIPIHADDRMLSVLPLHHTFECTVGFLCPLRVGASVAYARGLKSNELREDIRTSGATILLGVPLLYEKLLATIRRGIDASPRAQRLAARTLLGCVRWVRRTTGARVGLTLMTGLRNATGMDRIRLFVSGAAPLPADAYWGLVDMGWTVLEGYGLTECSPVVAANHVETSMPGSVGAPLAGVDVRIADPDADGNGEVLVRGAGVMLGYWEQPDLTAEVLRGGWFHTGDLGHLTGDGRLAITGRIKNMIATAAGKKIYPEEVEAALANCPYILEVVVAGGRDSGGREEVQAHVVPDRAALEALAQAGSHPFTDAFIEQTLRREVERACLRLAPYKRVKRVVVRSEEFPKTTTGKIRRPTTAEGADRNSAVA